MTSNTSAWVGLGVGAAALYLIARKVKEQQLEAEVNEFAPGTLEGFRPSKTRRPMGMYRSRRAALR